MKISIKLYKKNIANDVAAELNLMGRTLEVSANTDTSSASIRELAGFIKSPDDNETKPVMARSMTESWSSVKEACQRYLIYGRDTDDNRLENIFGIKKDTDLSFTGADWNNTSKWSTSAVTGYKCMTLDNACVIKKDTKYNICINLANLGITGASNDKCILIAGANTIELGEISKLTADNVVTLSPIVDYSGTAYIGFATRDGLNIGTAGITAASAVYTCQYNDWGSYNLELEMPESFNVGVTSTITSYAHRTIVDSVIAAILKNQQIDGYTKYIATAEAARNSLIRALQARSEFTRRFADWG